MMVIIITSSPIWYGSAHLFDIRAPRGESAPHYTPLSTPTKKAAHLSCTEDMRRCQQHLPDGVHRRLIVVADEH